MTGGLDRLEKFFSSSKKKDKEAQQKTIPPKDVDSIQTTSPKTDAGEAAVSFPSPSFLKPTSSRMQPRGPLYQRGEDEVQNSSCKDKARSRSLPDVKKSIRGQVSGISSLEVERKTRSYESRPQSIPELPSTPRLSGFRFPEDSLFRSAKTPDTSKSSARRSRTSAAASKSPKLEKDGQQLLDWSPRRISLMFKPNELLSMNGKISLELSQAHQEPNALMPSPEFTVPEIPPPRSPLRRKGPKTPPRPHTGEAPRNQNWNFSTFPKQYSVISSSMCQTYSPPTSDSEDDHSTIRQNPHFRPDAVNHSVTNSSPGSLAGKQQAALTLGQEAPRETWGVRHDDPKLQSHDSNSNPVPRLDLNIPSLPDVTLTGVTAIQLRILEEPTINDIYALSDEDIFEARPFTPAPEYPPPPPPPPKDDVLVRVRRRTLTPAIAQPRRVHAVDPTSGEITPPETPVDLQFLAPLPVRHSAGELGAIMTASIARKYNFDLIYLVKVWPRRGERYSDSSLGSGSGSPHHSVTFRSTLEATPGANISGQYLAAFGLDQVGEPLQIQAHVLQRALQNDNWNEIDDPTGPFSHGWVCSWANKRASVRSQGVGRKSLSAENRNRGVVFAAYSRRHNNTVLPRESPSTTGFLADLYHDAELLMETVLRRN